MSIAIENRNNLLFPQKLHKLLDDNLFEEIISWQPHGRSFKVHRKGDFVKKVYPMYFKKTVKYPSFQRQLSYYGFTRQDLPGPDKGGYYHPHFLRGCFSLCTQQVNRHNFEADENTLCDKRSRDESTGGGLKMTNLSKGPEPHFYRMKPLPPLASNQNKSKPDKEEFNDDTRRGSHDHLHPFMRMMGPVPPSHFFHSDTNQYQYYPRYGHNKEWHYHSTAKEPHPPRKDGWNHEVFDFYSAPSLSYDHDGRQNYHPFDPYHNSYEHHITEENATASSYIETRCASLPNGEFSHDTHNGRHFDNYHGTNDNVRKTLLPLHNRPEVRDEKRQQDESISSGKDSFIVSSTIQQKILLPYKNKECSEERGVVQVEPPSLSSTFDDERDSIEPVAIFPSSSSRSLNEAYSTMMVPRAAKSDSSLLSKDECRKSGEEDADIFGHRPIEEKALLDEARQCLNRASFEWDDAFISSSYSFS